MKCNGVAVSGAWTNPLSAGGVIEIDTVRIKLGQDDKSSFKLSRSHRRSFLQWA